MTALFDIEIGPTAHVYRWPMTSMTLAGRGIAIERLLMFSQRPNTDT